MKCKTLNKNTSSLSKISNGFTLEKRFETEFKKMEKIGTGGFSSVYKVMNILDNSFYAIKKIKIKVDKNNKDLQKEINSVLQEIRYLAKIKSEFIVTYNHSWVEIKIREPEESSIDNLDYEFNNSVISDELSITEKSDPCYDQYSSYKDDFIIINNKVYTFEIIDSISIFIQMELCKETLFDYIEKRNSKVDYYMDSLNIFEKILNGIEYIHKENLIHRDIKPKNIFFTYSGDIKIGDLGLATESLNKKCTMECPSPIERSFEAGYISDELCEDVSFHLEIEENFEEIHTSNIGTTQYAAPEQLNNIHYDKKVDIFSLGLILLELIYPFKTRMERQEVHYNLKNKRYLNPDFVDKFKDIAEIILSMTDIDPIKRPDIAKIKSKISIILKNLPKNKIDFKTRKRFLSEDIYSIKSYEFIMKLSESIEWKKIWIKIFNEKLLIYNKKNSDKANIIYDLKECEIKGNYVEDNHIIELNRNYSSTFVSVNKSKDRNGKRYSLDSRDEVKNYHLNYLIEIDHPYQQKCVLKNDYIFETVELYNKLKNIIN